MIELPRIESLRLSLGILQPTPFCNIACKYCYLPDKSSTRRMSDETLEHAVRFLMRRPGLLDEGSSLVWHCGEPLSVPFDFYRKAFATIDRLTPTSQPVQMCFSTNATLIDEEWCEIVNARGHIKMRVSIDGPQWLHDANRVDRAGKGTFDRVIRGIDLLRANGIPIDVLSTVTQRSLAAAEEMWHFFRDIGARSVGFCIEEVLGENRQSSLQFSDAAVRVKAFFDTWLRLRQQQDPTFFLRELDQIIEAISPGYQQPFIRSDNLPFSLITVGWDGSISLFSPELHDLKDFRYGDFLFGHVATDSVESILASPKFQLVYADIMQGVQKCGGECKYYRVCGGGFPVSKLMENGSFQSSETLTCRLRIKAITDVVLDHLSRKRAHLISAIPTSPFPVMGTSGSERA